MELGKRLHMHMPQTWSQALEAFLFRALIGGDMGRRPRRAVLAVFSFSTPFPFPHFLLFFSVFARLLN